jgi:hypothetical protein
MPDETWLKDVQHALSTLRGEATPKQICHEIENHRTHLGPNWREVVRATIYHNSSDSPAYEPENPDVFRKVTRGVWALRQPGSVISGRSKDAINMAILDEFGKDSETSRAAKESPERARDIVEDTRRTIKKRFRLGPRYANRPVASPRRSRPLVGPACAVWPSGI